MRTVEPSSFRGNQQMRHYECIDRVVVRNKGQPTKIGPLISLTRDKNHVNETCQEHGKNMEELCIPKCCGKFQVFDKTAYTCVTSNETVNFLENLAIHESYYPHEFLQTASRHDLKRHNVLLFDQKQAVEKSCSRRLAGLFGRNASVKFLADGSLYFDGIGAWDNDFCIDNFLDSKGEMEISGFKCRSTVGSFRDTNVCMGEKFSEFMKKFRLAYVICGCISLLFLLMTMYFYISLPSLCNLHGKIVISNLVAILFTTACLLLLFNVRAKLEKSKDNAAGEKSEFIIDLSTLPCKVVGYLTYYSGVSMFSWMSVMCWDLGWTFARAKIPRKGTDYVKFLLYSLVAWGVPMLLLLLVVLVDNDIFPADSFPITPEVGKETCFLSIAGLQKYFYLPISIMLSFNTVMFFVTVYTLWRANKFSRKAGLQRISSHHQCESKRMLRIRSVYKRAEGNNKSPESKGPIDRTHSSDTRDEMVLFVKLFFIMGLSWFSEIIHIELHGDHRKLGYCNFSLEVFLRVLGMFNVMRGVFIFVIFICKPSILKAIAERHPWISKRSINIYKPRRHRLSPNLKSDAEESIECLERKGHSVLK